MAGQHPVRAARRPRFAVLLVIVALSFSSLPSASADLSEYEYQYDELPRPHLRASRDSHIQHVPADAPHDAQDGSSSSAIQRVPRTGRAAGPAQPVEPVEPTAQSPPPLVDSAVPQEEAVLQVSPVPGSQVHAELSQPATGTKDSDTLDAKPKDSTQTASHKAGSEDMETANFFWGLGPVYPHLYVYRRIPHLVPLAGWNPYHSYYLAHPQR